MRTGSDDEMLRADEVGAELRVSPNTITLWIRQGRLPAYKVGRQWRIRRGDLKRVITQPQEAGSSPE